MIRYELKDKERQAALEKALPVFKKMLQHACENHRPEYFDEHKSVAVFYSTVDGTWGSGEWMIELPTDDIEVIKEYDPNKWNNYPEVTPPVGVPMRIEYKTSKGHIGGILALFFDGMWHRCTPDGTTCFLTLDRDVKRFRPWDDDFKPTEWVAPCKNL